MGTASAMTSRISLVRSATSSASALACFARCMRHAGHKRESFEEHVFTDPGNFTEGNDTPDGALQGRKSVSRFLECASGGPEYIRKGAVPTGVGGFCGFALRTRGETEPHGSVCGLPPVGGPFIQGERVHIQQLRQCCSIIMLGDVANGRVYSFKTASIRMIIRSLARW